MMTTWKLRIDALFILKKKQDTRGVDIVLCAAWKAPTIFIMSGLLMSFHHDQRQWLFKAPVTLPSDVDDKCIEISV